MLQIVDNLNIKEESNHTDASISKLCFIENKYVHKNKDENVHIYNLHRVIPRFIPADIFEIDIQSNLTKGEILFLSDYYKRVGEVEFWDAKIEVPPFYILRSLPYTISIQEMDNKYIQNMKEGDRDLIFNYYIKEEEKDCYILSSSFSKPEDMQVANILNLSHLQINDSEKAMISGLIERIDRIEKKNIFVSNMFVDPNHYYFFEHSLDHVPGMMLIETGRQFYTACCHIYGNVPISDVSFVLGKLNADFIDYLSLTYPIRIELSVDDITTDRQGIWTKSSGIVNIYQENSVKAKLTLGGCAFSNNIIEHAQSKNIIKHRARYKAIPHSSTIVYLDSIDNSVRFNGNIMDISYKHMLVEFMEHIDINKIESLIFNINHNEYLSANGKCILRWKRESEDGYIARFRITDIDEVNRDNIASIMRCICYEREKEAAI